MSDHKDGLGYSVKKIFIALLVLTAIEVAWGMSMPHSQRFLLWSGLMICALAKGLLIFMYFMHMRFERWIIWGLIVPTPVLVMIVLAANMPDTAFNDRRDQPVGYRIDATGNVVNALDPAHPAAGLGTPHQHAEGGAAVEKH
jgi:cytochrome c oxidase subunit IV